MKVQSDWIHKELTESAIEEISKFSKDIATSDKNPTKGYPLNNDVKTSKLRRFYGEVKRIQSKGILDEKNSFRMLKPKLAYAVGREDQKNNPKLKDLFIVLSDAIDNVEIDKIDNENELKKRFSNFVQLFEAIVAYHKFHGGKE